MSGPEPKDARVDWILDKRNLARHPLGRTVNNIIVEAVGVASSTRAGKVHVINDGPPRVVDVVYGDDVVRITGFDEDGRLLLFSEFFRRRWDQFCDINELPNEPILPPRATVADSVLIFVADPDAAEVLVGDLVERMAQVQARKSATLTWCWFWWQLGWITLHQGLARIKDKTVLGKLGDAIIKRIGG